MPSFRQSDVTRALKAHINAGLTPRRTEIDESGKIVVICSEQAPIKQPDSPVDFEARLREQRGWAT